MSKGAYDVFALVINFWGNDWQSKHVIISLFEATKTIGQTLARTLTKLLDKYGLRKKIIAYVKNEGSNLHVMIIPLKAIVNYEYLGLEKSFQGIGFGHFFQRHVNMAFEEENMCKDLKYVFIKSTQANLQKCITWPKKLGKGRHDGTKVVLKPTFAPKN